MIAQTTDVIRKRNQQTVFVFVSFVRYFIRAADDSIFSDD